MTRWKLTATFTAEPAAVDRLRRMIGGAVGRFTDLLDVGVIDWNIEPDDKR